MDWAAQELRSAEIYDSYLGPAIFQPWAERMVEVTAPRAGDRILDLGCGTGRVARALLDAAPGAEIVGVDAAAAQLEVARRRQPHGVRWIQASADALPFGDASFTALTCQQALQFFDDRPAALAEVRRVLGSPGRLAVATWSGLVDQPLQRAIHAVLRHHLGDRADRMTVAFGLSSSAELSGLLRAAGFVDVTVRRETLAARFTPGGELATRFLLAGPSAPAYERLPQATRDAIVADIGGAFPPDANDAVVTTMTSNLATGRT